jgi:putative molybdopterin biosynthesis protein
METLLTIKELSEILKINENSIYQMVHKREIPFIKLGGRLRFQLSEIEKYVKQNSHSPKDQNTYSDYYKNPNCKRRFT